MFIINCLSCKKIVDAHNAVFSDCEHYHTEDRESFYTDLKHMRDMNVIPNQTEDIE